MDDAAGRGGRDGGDARRARPDPPGWQPDPEAELAFARRAGMSEREVDRIRQGQRRPDRPAWPSVLRATLLFIGAELLLDRLRAHHVPTLQRYAVALGALVVVSLAEVAVRVAHRRGGRR